jgi:hypothetical protein
MAVFLLFLPILVGLSDVIISAWERASKSEDGKDRIHG